MKKIASFILFIAGSTLLGAQNDTTFITTATEEGVFEKQTFNDRYEEAFGVDERVRSLWKVTNFFAPSLNESMGNGFEIKLTRGLSLNLAIDTYIRISSTHENIEVSPRINRIRLEPRYYYAMPRRIREGKSANNVSGNYLGLELTYPFDDEWNATAAGRSLMARFGIQRRLFRFLYFDISAGAGVYDNREWKAYNGAGDYVFFLSPRIMGGIAIASFKAKKSSQGDSKCQVLGCFQEENRLYKVNLLNVLRMTDLNYLSTGIDFAAERKIGQSPFSVEASAGFSAARRRAYTEFGIDYGQQTLRAGVEGRWYYTLNKRIATGKSGNNLQGAYLALATSLGLEFNQIDGIWTGTGPTDYRVRTRQLYVQPKIGYQQRLFKHAYVNFSVGPSLLFERQKDLKSGVVLDIDPQFDWITSQVGVGVAF